MKPESIKKNRQGCSGALPTRTTSLHRPLQFLPGNQAMFAQVIAQGWGQQPVNRASGALPPVPEARLGTKAQQVTSRHVVFLPMLCYPCSAGLGIAPRFGLDRCASRAVPYQVRNCQGEMRNLSKLEPCRDLWLKVCSGDVQRVQACTGRDTLTSCEAL